MKTRRTSWCSRPTYAHAQTLSLYATSSKTTKINLDLLLFTLLWLRTAIHHGEPGGVLTISILPRLVWLWEVICWTGHWIKRTTFVQCKKKKHFGKEECWLTTGEVLLNPSASWPLRLMMWTSCGRLIVPLLAQPDIAVKLFSMACTGWPNPTGKSSQGLRNKGSAVKTKQHD